MLSISEQKTSYKLKNILFNILMFLCPPFAIIRIFLGKGSITEKIAKTIFFIIFFVYSASIIFIVFWTFYNSFKSDIEFYDNMMAFPKVWRFSNYKEAYDYIRYDNGVVNVSLIQMFFNSIWFAGGSAFLATLMHAITGYIFAKYTFPGQKIAFKIILFTIALPIVGSLPSLYKIIYTLHMNDSPLILIMYLGGFGSNFLIMYAFFRGVDRTYMEAAEIDGANRFTIFFKIMLPLAFGPFISLFLLTFVAQWNNYETPLLFLDKMPTLSSGLFLFYEQMTFSESSSPHTVFFAGILLASIPVIIMVSLFGDKMMKNVNMGGIKG